MSAPEIRTEAGRRLTEGREPGPGNLLDTPMTALDAAWAMLERESLMAGGETHAALFRIHRAAIEAEAIATERARITRYVEALPLPQYDPISRRLVLAIVNGEAS